MSAPPSPHINAQYRKKDRPPALEIPQDDKHASSDGEIRYQHANLGVDLSSKQVSYQSPRWSYVFKPNSTSNQPSVHISPAQEEQLMDHDPSISRSTSTTSSLDPYYFGIRSPSDSPVPPLPTGLIHLSSTPDQRPVQDPVTPARDPAAIDRRGLVGVGELATPRWTRIEYRSDLETPDNADEGAEFDVLAAEVTQDDEPDSPWTIEAVDSEASEKEDVRSLIMICWYFVKSPFVSLSGVGYQAHLPSPSQSAFNRG